MSSGLFCVYPVFLLCCLRNRLVLLLSFLRVAFGSLLYLSYLSFVLLSESSCVYSVISPCYLRNPLVFILPFFRIAFGALLCLYCSCFVFILFLFVFYVVFKSY